MGVVKLIKIDPARMATNVLSAQAQCSITYQALRNRVDCCIPGVEGTETKPIRSPTSGKISSM